MWTPYKPYFYILVWSALQGCDQFSLPGTMAGWKEWNSKAHLKYYLNTVCISPSSDSYAIRIIDAYERKVH